MIEVFTNRRRGPIIMRHDDPSVTPTNRFITPDGKDLVVSRGSTVHFEGRVVGDDSIGWRVTEVVRYRKTQRVRRQVRMRRKRRRGWA